MSKCYICGKEISDIHVVCRECSEGLAKGKITILPARQSGKTYIRGRIAKDILMYSLTKEEVEALFEEYMKGEK